MSPSTILKKYQIQLWDLGLLSQQSKTNIPQIPKLQCLRYFCPEYLR